MDNENRNTEAEDLTSSASESPEDQGRDAPSSPVFEETLFEEAAALIDDGRNYAQAEIAFQKTRAKLAGRSVGIALLCVILALILLNIAFLALAVGLVIALEPLVTIWGAIAIVVGVLLLCVGILGFIALRNGQKLGTLFGEADET